MKDKIKVVQIGTGKMSVYTMRYVYEKGAEIVGAFDINPNVIGKDIGEIANIPNKEVLVEDIENLKARLKDLKPDIAIVTTMSLLSDVADTLLTCAKCGVNAITTCEEAFDAYNSNPKLTEEINKLAIINTAQLLVVVIKIFTGEA